MASRLYIITRDVREGGGVSSKARFLYSIAKTNGYDPCLVFNNLLDRDAQIRFSNPLEALRFDASSAVGHTELDGREVKMIPLVLPEIEFGQYLLNVSAWRDAIGDGDLFFAVGGTNQCSLPLARAGMRFGSWTGTPLWEDRIDRLESAPLIEQVRDRFSRPILEYIERRGYEAADPVFVVSEYTAERISTRYGLDRASIEVVPYPIDTRRFSPSEPRENDAPPTILFAGRFNDPRKNIELLVAAFEAVRKHVPGARLRLIGEEPSESLQETVVKHGLSEVVEFPGKVRYEALPEHYQSADVFVIPSNQEGLGIVGLEAMACGTPVVATRCGGPEQYVREGETGYLVSCGDHEALGDRIRYLFENDNLRMQLGDNARMMIEQHYDSDIIRDRFLEVLRKLDAPPE